MARMHTVEAARKPQTCRVCGGEIKVGDPYKWTKPRYKGKIAAHPNCKIPLSMTSSSKMVAIWEAQESFDRTDSSSIAEGLREFAETVRVVGQEYQEGADNQREYFPDSETADENEEKAQELESWADEIDGAAQEAEDLANELEELISEKEDLEGKLEGGFYDKDEDEQQVASDRISELEGEIEDKETEITDKADILDECPV